MEHRTVFERALQHLFFWLVVRPVVLVVIGLHVRHRERLPDGGPAVLAANHNSHLDAMVLTTLLSPRLLGKVRPVAAADYFLRNRALSWFSRKVLGIIPIRRGAGRERTGDPPAGEPRADDPLAGVQAALDRGEIVILFPEGTRGEPERMAALKSGIAHLALANPAVPVIPVHLYGLGKTLPKGAVLPVPFFCDVAVGEPLRGGDPAWGGDRQAFLAELSNRMAAMAAEAGREEWR